MKHAIGESLSALMDQQADDLDLQRVINDLDDDEVCRRWRRYHLASAAMRNDLGEFAGVDLTAAIQDTLAQEESVISEPVRPVPVRSPRARFSAALKPVASVAVAASVTAAIIGGTQLYHAVLGDPVAPPVLTADNANGNVSAALAGNRRVGFAGPMAPVSSPAGLARVDARVAQQPLVLDYNQADAMARKKLNAHLQSHLENASLNTSSGMMPFARAASDQGAR